MSSTPRRAPPGRPVPETQRVALRRLVALVGWNRAGELLRLSTSALRNAVEGRVVLYGTELALIDGLHSEAVEDLLRGPRLAAGTGPR
jgi:hypothetical protein